MEKYIKYRMFKNDAYSGYISWAMKFMNSYNTRMVEKFYEFIQYQNG